MKYIKDLTEGARVSDIYLVKSRTSAVTKTGKDYWNVVLQDKSGAVYGTLEAPELRSSRRRIMWISSVP